MNTASCGILKGYKKMKRVFFILSAALLVPLLFAPARHASAAPHILITWQSNSLAPAAYSGKILPAANSPIAASIEVIRDGGTLVDLSSESIHWFANETPIGSGTGMQTITFRAPSLPGGTINLRAELPNFAEGGFIADTIQIPVALPVAIIEPPFPGSSFSGTTLQLKAHPYFFNVPSSASLTFGWEVNGNPPSSSGNPEGLTVTLGSNAPDGAQVNINLKIKNPDALYEAAEETAAFTYHK